MLKLGKIKKNKKSQQVLGMSFGTIFSILLIIFFVIITFIVLKKFLFTSDCTRVGMFIDGFDEAVQDAWNSQKDTLEFSKSLPKDIEYVCFADFEKSRTGEFEKPIGFDIWVFEGSGSNVLFYPSEEACNMRHFYNKHLDINDLTKRNNPNCFKTDKGKITLTLIKEYNSRYVKIR